MFGSEVALTVIGGVAADSVAYYWANAFGIGNGNASASTTPVKVDIAKARLTAGSQPGVTERRPRFRKEFTLLAGPAFLQY